MEQMMPFMMQVASDNSNAGTNGIAQLKRSLICGSFLIMLQIIDMEQSLIRF